MLSCTCTLSSPCKCLVSICLLRVLAFAYIAFAYTFAYMLTCLHGAGIALAKQWVAPSGVSE